MKLKGKLIGGILGACFGGPFGIALGVAIGHVCDSVADSSEVSLAARSKFIELACEGISKIAKADGRVSEAEISEIEKIFVELRLDSDTRAKAVGHLRHSKNSNETLGSVARRFCAVFPNYEAREGFFIMLLRVALSDGTLNGREREALIEAAAELGVNASKFPGLGGDEYGRRQEVPNGELMEAYATLGLPFDTPIEEVKKVYRAKCKELHPDILRSKGVGEYAIEAMESELKRLNEAYEKIKNSGR